MSTIVATGHQIGQHANTLNNFTWYQPGTPNGSVILGQGNYGNATAVLTVSSTTVTFGTLGISANGTVGTSGQILTSNGSSAYWANNNAATTGKAIAMAIVFGG